MGINFDDIAEWQFWAHHKYGGDDLFCRYPPTKINLAIRRREQLLKDESIARVEPIIGVTFQEMEEAENSWKELEQLARSAGLIK